MRSVLFLLLALSAGTCGCVFAFTGADSATERTNLKAGNSGRDVANEFASEFDRLGG